MLPYHCSKQAKSARTELLECIATDDKSKSIRIAQLVETLLANPPRFKEQLLGGGPWQVVYTQGAFLWQLYTSPGQLVTRSSNRASQAFDPKTRDVLNSGEIAGPSIQVSAVGSYTPVDSSTVLPKEIDVEITGGEIDAWGRKIKVPIKGKGNFFIEYVDESIRVFRSTGGGLSMQIREDKLDILRKGGKI